MDAPHEIAPPDRRARLLGMLSFWALYLYVFPYYPGLNNPNENVRIYMTAALVEEGSYEISPLRRRWGWTNDAACVQWVAGRSEPCARRRPGAVRRYYSVKGPLTSWMGVPAYAVLYALEGPQPRLMPHVVWWLRTTAVAFPFAVFLWFFHGWLGRNTRSPLLRDVVYVGTALGSVLFGYANLFASHTTSAAAAFGAFMILDEAARNGRKRWGTSWLAGLLAASATALEYPCILFTAPLCVHALFALRSRRHVLAFGLGALLPTLLVMHFQASAFGNPFTPGHLFVENPAFRAGHESGFFGADRWRPEALWGQLFDLRLGLFTTSPMLLLAVSAPLYRRARHDRIGHYLALFATLSLYVVISAMNNWQGGWSIGPRHLVVLVPFVAMWALFGLDALHARNPTSAEVLALGGAIASVAVSQVYALYPHLPEHLDAPFRQLFWPLWKRGLVPANVGAWLGLEGLPSLLPLLLLCAASLYWSGRSLSHKRHWATAALVGLLALAPHLLLGNPDAPGAVRDRNLVTRHWWPPRTRSRHGDPSARGGHSPFETAPAPHRRTADTKAGIPTGPRPLHGSPI